jgi:hypothetical protein
MKTSRLTRAFLATAFVITVATGAWAQAPKALEGTWKLNVAKSKFSPGPAPKSMTLTYSAVGTDGVRIVVDLVPPEGPAQHWETTAHYDGKDYRISGNPTADMITTKRIDDRTGESTFKKDGKVTVTNRRTLSPDGKTLTITSSGVTADGRRRRDVQVFEK